MIKVLKEAVIPTLREMGFAGSFPHFRRLRDSQIDLLTFQFSRWGGSFVVEVAFCQPGGITTHWGKHIGPKKVTAHDVSHCLRLGSHPPGEVDHWFSYESTQADPFMDAALELLPYLRGQAEQFWTSHTPSIG